MRINLTGESYIFDEPFPKGFDPMVKRYEPTEIMKYGRLTHRKENDALVQYFLAILTLNKFGYYSGASTTYLTLTDIGGTNRNVYNQANAFRFDYNLGISQNWGTVIGTGTNAVTIADTKLQTQIASGVSANQLIYGIQQYSAGPYTSGSSRYFLIGRTFTNISGGNITVQEMGIYVYHATGPYYYCIARDLTGGVTINDGKVGYFQYKWTISV